MKQATKKKSHREVLYPQVAQRLVEALMILALACAFFLTLSLATHTLNDSAWSHVSTPGHIQNAGGIFGAYFSDITFYFFGYFAYLMPLTLLVVSVHYFVRDKKNAQAVAFYPGLLRVIGLFFALSGGSALITVYPTGLNQLPLGDGGLIGQLISESLQDALGRVGSNLLLLSFLLSGITLATGLSWLRLAQNLTTLLKQLLITSYFKTICYCNMAGRFVKHFLQTCYEKGKAIWESRREQRLQQQYQRARRAKDSVTTKKEKTTQGLIKSVLKKKSQDNEQQAPVIKAKPQVVATPATITSGKRAMADKQLALFKKSDVTLPAFSLLESPKRAEQPISKERLEGLSELVEIKLADFGVKAEVVAVYPGPVITRFELKLAPGIKVSKISGLAKDLARSLAVVSVRVVEVIPGKPVVGLELPNDNREVVCFQEVIVSTEYEKMTSPLALALGKDISGNPVIIDLAKMPHLLVAGTTGSGKSVGLNGMLLSILFKATPEEVRLILIDPKMLELAVYDDIPHLLAPVVTDMKEAANSLRWCVAEMERRYQLMAALGVRNLAGFNRKVTEAIKQKKPIIDPLCTEQVPDEEKPVLEPMPFIVVVIDEFADMMMVVGKKVEELIARIAQKARAAGIHLILATQRPSVDVVTGLIKANVPSRIAFQVATRIDSRTILDQQGAEQLLGRGDMLYLPIGAGVPTRIHGAFVEDQEVHDVVSDLKSRGEPQYIEDVIHGTHGQVQGVDKALLMQDDEQKEAQDDLYDHAVRIVTETRRASISLVQRRLKIGYNRAARLVEQMESEGVVSPMQSNGSREVLAPPPVEL